MDTRQPLITVIVAGAMLAGSEAALGQAASAPAPVWESGEAGQTLIAPMRSAPYPHESRKDGFKARDKAYPREPHYADNSVALFIPKGFHAGETTDVLFYFHGHLNNVRSALGQFKLREQVLASGKNVIMAFPQGPRDAADSGGGRLEEKDGLRRLADEVLARLNADGRIPTRRLGRVLLAGHSGAYRILSFCVQHGGLEEHVSDVALLDSSYAQLDAFVDWAARRPSGRLFSIFTDHLAPENVYLMTHLRERSVPYELMAEQDARDSQVRATRVLFLHAEKLNHNGTVQWLQRWLADTSLPSR
jgi:hypothetical protein